MLVGKELVIDVVTTLDIAVELGTLVEVEAVDLTDEEDDFELETMVVLEETEPGRPEIWSTFKHHPIGV